MECPHGRNGVASKVAAVDGGGKLKVDHPSQPGYREGNVLAAIKSAKELSDPLSSGSAPEVIREDFQVFQERVRGIANQL